VIPALLTYLPLDLLTVAQSVVEWGGASADVVRTRAAWCLVRDNPKSPNPDPDPNHVRLPAACPW